MIGGVTSGTMTDPRNTAAALNPRNTAAAIGVASITALRYVQSDGYAVVIPVRPAQAVHASFRHIQVLPDARLQDGVPLYKLKILDALIDKLSPGGVASTRPSPAGSAGVAGVAGGPGRPGAVDRLIGDLSRGLRIAEGEAARGVGSGAYRAGFLPLPGAFVDLVA